MTNKDEIVKLVEGIDVSHIQNDDQLLRELTNILNQVNEECLKLQMQIDEISK